jgi:hypothetical protein
MHNRRVRCAALFALASVVQSSGEDRQVEAGELYEKFLDEFDGQYKYFNQVIEQHYHQWAKIQLDEIRSRGIGKPAPEIVGVDLDGRPMKLSDYRGKVVLLSFWGTWCVTGRRWQAISKDVAIQNRPKCPPGQKENRTRPTNAPGVSASRIARRFCRSSAKASRPSESSRI